jgi:hypothetical protein
VERVTDGPIPYLTVRIDLSSLRKGGRYAKRIVAAWVYPDLTRGNYGVRSLGVKMTSLAVTDDSEEGGNDGDWRFWVGVPSNSQPWTQLLDCEGCVDDDTTYTPSSSLWKAGALGPGGIIVRDLTLFRTQGVLVTTTGFEEDLMRNDPIGNASVTFLTAATVRADKYVARFETIPNAPLPLAIISPQLALHTGRLKISLTPAVQTQLNVLSLRAGELDRLRTEWAREASARKREGDEQDPDLSGTGLAAAFSRSKPAEQTAFVVAIRKRALRRLGPNPDAPTRARLARELRDLKGSIPAPLYKRHLCEVETGKPCF